MDIFLTRSNTRGFKDRLSFLHPALPLSVWAMQANTCFPRAHPAELRLVSDGTREPTTHLDESPFIIFLRYRGRLWP